MHQPEGKVRQEACLRPAVRTLEECLCAMSGGRPPPHLSPHRPNVVVGTQQSPDAGAATSSSWGLRFPGEAQVPGY